MVRGKEASILCLIPSSLCVLPGMDRCKLCQAPIKRSGRKHHLVFHKRKFQLWECDGCGFCDIPIDRLSFRTHLSRQHQLTISDRELRQRATYKQRVPESYCFLDDCPRLGCSYKSWR